MPDFHVYASCFGAGCVEAFRADGTTGELEHLQSVGVRGNGLTMTHSPDRRFLYAAAIDRSGASDTPYYEAMRIDPATGQLDRIATVKAPAYMVHVSMDRSGRFLLGASEPTGVVAATAVGRRGIPQEYPADAVARLGRPHHITTGASNRSVYVPCMATDRVLQLAFDDRTGRFGSVAESESLQPAGGGPRHMAHHPTGRWVYLDNQHDGSLVVFGIDRDTGALMEIQRSTYLADDFEGDPRGAQIHVAPNGRFLFVSERTRRTIAGWAIDPETGRLSGRRMTECAVGLRCFDIDASSRFLAIGGLNTDKIPDPPDSKSVAVYAIDPASGALSIRAEMPCASSPYWIEIVDIP